MDREVEDGQKIVLTPAELFCERCARYLRLIEMGAPYMLVDNEAELIEKAAKQMKGADFAKAMHDFPGVVARHLRIAAEVDREHPPDP